MIRLSHLGGTNNGPTDISQGPAAAGEGANGNTGTALGK